MYISCIFHVVCALFSALATRKLADAEVNSSGIWALFADTMDVLCHINFCYRKCFAINESIVAAATQSIQFSHGIFPRKKKNFVFCCRWRCDWPGLRAPARRRSRRARAESDQTTYTRRLCRTRPRPPAWAATANAATATTQTHTEKSTVQ